MPAATTWDPQQYGRFAGERGRPLVDLVHRIGADRPRQVVDLGCGPGEPTLLLARRWPEATVVGVDSSPEMIRRALAVRAEQPADVADRVSFVLGDLADWRPGPETDVVVSNAALQWVPGHRALLAGWLDALPDGAWFGWQVPGNFDAPSHRLLREIAAGDRWRERLRGVLRHDPVDDGPGYLELLLQHGWRAEAWETTYLHLLPGADPVLEWVRGTALRPVLDALGRDTDDTGDTASFEAEYAAALRAAYPATPHGTVLPFRRIFAVGSRG
ncbi:trans-aconitate 2-methyltransferase [Nakamurella endophytica]|uniref:trans-aconitate 2-methyltransferase n=1 Tax=Nakamurella endophytica TaxID=1748367 RepID=UPI00166C4A6F|nr:trans-aconitate 2-methyltransferase [Nakamurella endophytica]